MAVSKRLRYEILRRDNYTCRYCGASAPDVKITVDHVLPITLGGGDTAENLVSACGACNAGKSASNPDAPLVADVSQRALRWQQAIHVAAQLRARDYEPIRLTFDSLINHWMETFQRAPDALPDLDAEVTISKLASRGLELDVMKRMVDVTFSAWCRNSRLTDESCWSYFAGCCWRSVTELEATAHQVLENGGA